MKNLFQNKTFRAIVMTGKIMITALLVFFTYEMYVYTFEVEKTSDAVADAIVSAVPTFIAIFVLLPTIFVFFFKNRLVVRYPKFTDFWKFGRLAYGVIVVLFLIYAIGGVWRIFDKDRTEKAVFRINSVRVTLADVMGENLPSKPDQTLSDSTIEGIDANDNFIRDDVELAIFEKYPNSAKIRAAMLQYAQALQMELTMVFNTKTFIASLKKESRGVSCLGETGPRINLEDSHEKILSDFAVSDKWQEEIENSILNTETREAKQENNFEKYMTTYSSPSGKQCDVDLEDLSN